MRNSNSNPTGTGPENWQWNNTNQKTGSVAVPTGLTWNYERWHTQEPDNNFCGSIPVCNEDRGALSGFSKLIDQQGWYKGMAIYQKLEPECNPPPTPPSPKCDVKANTNNNNDNNNDDNNDHNNDDNNKNTC